MRKVIRGWMPRKNFEGPKKTMRLCFGGYTYDPCLACYIQVEIRQEEAQTMSVKRFHNNQKGRVFETGDGEYVRYADYALLEARIHELEAKLKQLVRDRDTYRSFRDNLKERLKVYQDAGYELRTINDKTTVVKLSKRRVGDGR